MNADGSGATRLTNYADYDGQPAWAPDSTKIAFVRRVEGKYRIWVMNADGSNPRQYSNQPSSENPVWSSDGSQIAYDADGNGDSWQEIWLMDLAGGNQRQVYHAGGAQHRCLGAQLVTRRSFRRLHPHLVHSAGWQLVLDHSFPGRLGQRQSR